MASDTILFSPEEITKLAEVIAQTKELISHTTNDFIEKNVVGELEPNWITPHGKEMVKRLKDFLTTANVNFSNELTNKERGMREVARLAREMEQL